MSRSLKPPLKLTMGLYTFSGENIYLVFFHRKSDFAPDAKIEDGFDILGIDKRDLPVGRVGRLDLLYLNWLDTHFYISTREFRQFSIGN